MSNSKPRFDGEWVALGELIKKAKVERCGDRSLPVYSMTMHNGIVEQSGRFKKSVASKDTGSYKIVKKNQLVVGFPIDEGVIYVQNYDQPGIMSPAYNVWDFDTGRILPAYLELALHSPRSMAYYAEKLHGTTARRRSLTADALRSMIIALPTIERQHEIVTILDDIKSQISAAQKTLSNFDALVKSQFVAMFGDPGDNPMKWPIKSLTSLGECRNGLNFRSEDSGYEIPCLGVSDFQDRSVINDISLLNTITVNSEPASNHLLKNGDIVFVRSNGNKELVGRCLAIYPGESKVTFSGFCIRLRVTTPQVRIPFLVWALKHPSLRRQMLGQGANVQNLSQKKLDEIRVPIPPLGTQDEFLNLAAQVDKSRFG